GVLVAEAGGAAGERDVVALDRPGEGAVGGGGVRVAVVDLVRRLERARDRLRRDVGVLVADAREVVVAGVGTAQRGAVEADRLVRPHVLAPEGRRAAAEADGVARDDAAERTRQDGRIRGAVVDAARGRGEAARD